MEYRTSDSPYNELNLKKFEFINKHYCRGDVHKTTDIILKLVYGYNGIVSVFDYLNFRRSLKC